METEFQSIIQRVVRGSGIVKKGSRLTIMPIAADGSARRFWRVMTQGHSLCLAVAPPAGESQKDLAEAQAARFIGRHLQDKNVPVPEQYGWDEETGLLLFEDLGEQKLYDLVKTVAGHEKEDWSKIISLYQQSVEHLATMQIYGVDGFDPAWCWDTEQYDREVMVERESGYFIRAFWQGLLGQEIPAGLLEECDYLAGLAAEAPACYFLHRDFQSRNIMILNGQPRFIDFQGGRFGPLAYDLASLLIDPYVGLSEEMQEELISCYLRALRKLTEMDEQQFLREYQLLALQRNLQIVGAFSFLSQQRGKRFFFDFIEPSLQMLAERLRRQDLPQLYQLVQQAVSLFKRQ